MTRASFFAALAIVTGALHASCHSPPSSDPDAGGGAEGARADAPPTTIELGTWMKANAAPAMAERDLPALARVFVRIGATAPAAYPEWTSMAERGERAARAGDLEGCRASCKACHDAHRGRYKKERREQSATANRASGDGGNR